MGETCQGVRLCAEEFGPSLAIAAWAALIISVSFAFIGVLAGRRCIAVRLVIGPPLLVTGMLWFAAATASLITEISLEGFAFAGIGYVPFSLGLNFVMNEKWAAAVLAGRINIFGGGP